MKPTKYINLFKASEALNKNNKLLSVIIFEIEENLNDFMIVSHNQEMIYKLMNYIEKCKLDNLVEEHDLISITFKNNLDINLNELTEFVSYLENFFEEYIDMDKLNILKSRFNIITKTDEDELQEMRSIKDTESELNKDIQVESNKENVSVDLTSNFITINAETKENAYKDFDDIISILNDYNITYTGQLSEASQGEFKMAITHDYKGK